MNAPLKSKEPAACYGVCCEKHIICARYAAVNGAPASREFIGTCDTTRKVYPLFVMVEA